MESFVGASQKSQSKTTLSVKLLTPLGILELVLPSQPPELEPLQDGVALSPPIFNVEDHGDDQECEDATHDRTPRDRRHVQPMVDVGLG